MKIPEPAPPLDELWAEVVSGSDPAPLLRQIMAAGGEEQARGRYLHWDQLRRRTPPDGLDHRQWWLGIKQARLPIQTRLPLTDADGRHFTYAMTDRVLEHVHLIDQQAAGGIKTPEVVTAPGSTSRYVVRSLIEEAITSSQLEGATTTRRVAKEMILTGREPRTRSERMILNNYQGVLFVREIAEEDLTPEAIVELHRVLTEGTLDDPRDVGRIQEPGEDRVAIYWADDFRGPPLHRPPPAELLPKRLRAMCEFANGGGVDGFLHPVVRSIVVHLWLAYDHPFVDGNGRTARALFYWSMLRQGYWLTEYLSISSILRKAPAKYARSFLHSETDSLDATYLVLAQLGVIQRAIDEMNAYLTRKVEEVREVEALMRGSARFNHRQRGLLASALRDPHDRYTFASHARRFDVTYQSARTDLLDLAREGLLTREKIGRKYVFAPVSDLPERLKQR